MKKAFSLIIAACLAVSLLAGCGSSTPAATQAPAADNGSNAPQQEAPAAKKVMTIGDTTYTINGVEKSMDVAPEITGDRTYVPVRFVAEGLGFKVTPLYADNGTTTSVVFEK